MFTTTRFSMGEVALHVDNGEGGRTLWVYETTEEAIQRLRQMECELARLRRELAKRNVAREAARS